MCGQDKILTIPIVIVTTRQKFLGLWHHITRDADPLDVTSEIHNPSWRLLRDETRPPMYEKCEVRRNSTEPAKAPR